MNFNPMDLIKLKESIYEKNSIPFDVITKFISKLIDLQNEQYHQFPNNIKDVLSSDFFKKQEMIEGAFKMCQMNFDFMNKNKVSSKNSTF